MDKVIIEEYFELERKYQNEIKIIIVPVVVGLVSIGLAALAIVLWNIPYLWALLSCVIVIVLIIRHTDKIYFIRAVPLLKKRRELLKKYPEIRKCYRERHGLI